MTRIRFYLTFAGRSPVEDFIKALPDEVKEQFYEAILKLSGGGKLTMPLSRPLSAIHSGLHELRIKDRNGQIRIFYYLKQSSLIYILHAFRKKTRELPQQEIRLILRRIKEV